MRRKRRVGNGNQRSSKPQVIIAGAGVAGLTATHRLLQRGYDVTLIEADDFVGGKLGAHRDMGGPTKPTARLVRSASRGGAYAATTGMNIVIICI